MNVFSEIYYLLQKEFLLEFRRRFAIGGIVLYVLSTVFIVWTTVQNAGPALWNVLYWIIMLFAAVNAVMKSFVQESGYRQLYYWQLFRPAAVLLAKMIYNALLLLMLSVLTFGALSFVAGCPIENSGIFALSVFLGSVGFSVTFTFVSAIVTKADNSSTLMAILSFPVVIPVLLLIVHLSAHAMGLLQGISLSSKITMLLAVDLLLTAVGLALYPLLWRD